MNLLAIDPSIHHLGYAIFRSDGEYILSHTRTTLELPPVPSTPAHTGPKKGLFPVPSTPTPARGSRGELNITSSKPLLLDSGCFHSPTALRERKLAGGIKKWKKQYGDDTTWLRDMDWMLNKVSKLITESNISVVVCEQPEHFLSSSRGTAATNSGAIYKLTAMVFSLRQLCASGKIITKMERQTPTQAPTYAPAHTPIPTYTPVPILEASMAPVGFHLAPVTTWKGSTPKEIIMRRVKKRWLWAGTDHNEAEAIAIGAWYFGELDKERLKQAIAYAR